jgi:hypothetical protein
VKPYPETMSCQIAMALRPRLSPSSTMSRYGSQALAEGSGLGGWSGSFSGICPIKSVVTSLPGSMKGAVKKNTHPQTGPGNKVIVAASPVSVGDELMVQRFRTFDASFTTSVLQKLKSGTSSIIADQSSI